MFVIALVGETVETVSSALGRLAGCSLHHALQLPHQASLQPQGWLARRCRCYHDAASGTLWVGLAAAAVPQAPASAVMTRDEAREREAEATRALLLLFLTSHAVLWLQPAQVLCSTHLLGQLRLMQQLKTALLPALPTLLGVAAAEATAAVPGLSVPQLLLLVQPPPAQQRHQQQAKAMGGEAATEHPLPMLLKRCRILQPEDGSVRGLCTLPAAASLLLLLPEHVGSNSQEQLVAEALAVLLTPPTLQQQPAAKPVAAATAVAAALAPHRAAMAAMVEGSSQHEMISSWQQAITMLAAVLEAAAVAPPAGAAVAGAPDVAVPPEAAAAAAWQSACSRAVWDFSLASCKRAAAVASDAYRRNTPALLPAAGHAVALQAALRLYRSMARGPAAAAGAEAMQQQLDARWRDGHMQCDAVSFLGNPCCLPAHDPQQQAHTSSSSGSGTAATPQLLLASGSGAQQHSIPEPFTVAELQRAAAAVASDSSSAVARAQFYVRWLASPGSTTAGAGSAALGAATAGTAGAAAGPSAATGLEVGAAAGLGTAGVLLGEEAEVEAAARALFSGHSGHSSGEEEEASAAGSPTAAAMVTAVGTPAPGCWLELHVLGPRSMWKSPALAAALLMDGQPGWLRTGGVVLASLPVLAVVPLKPGQQSARVAAAQVTAAADEDEDFPSLETVKQRAQQRQQRRQPAGKKQQKKKQQQAQEAAAGAGSFPAVEEEAAVQLPAALSWPGWREMQVPPRAPLFAPAAGGKQPPGPGKQRSGKLQAAAAAAVGATVLAAAAAAGPSAAAAAAVAAGTAVTEQVSVLLGVEYESVQGQRLLLTPTLLAAAVQSSLDTVSVRQHSAAAGRAAAVASPARSKTAEAAAVAAHTPAAGAAALLLQQDLPLWLQLPAEQLTRLAGTSKRRNAAAMLPSGSSERPVWLQLRRLLIATPDVAIPMEADPQLRLEVPYSMLAPVMPGAGAAAARGTKGSSDATVQLQYSLAAPLAIPPASFCVLALPWLLTAPMSHPSAGVPAAVGGSGPAALIRQSGPLRAVLARHSVVRPKGLQLEHTR